MEKEADVRIALGLCHMKERAWGVWRVQSQVATRFEDWQGEVGHDDYGGFDSSRSIPRMQFGV